MADERITPVHPGIYLNELMEELALSQERLARDLEVTEKHIIGILDGSQAITAELSLRLVRFLNKAYVSGSTSRIGMIWTWPRIR
jgi:antitoxin HigA-1